MDGRRVVRSPVLIVRVCQNNPGLVHPLDHPLQQFAVVVRPEREVTALLDLAGCPYPVIVLQLEFDDAARQLLHVPVREYHPPLHRVSWRPGLAAAGQME